jgi:CRP-like cAMP-binding protein
MPQRPSRSTSPNQILSCLSREDFGLLRPHLQSVDLPVRKQLESCNKRIEHAYFPERGFASVVANGSGSRPIEVGIIGREGMTGLAVVLGNDRSPHETYIQAAGDGQRISAASLRHVIGRSATLHRSMLRYAHRYLIQTAQTALANGRSKLEERLARWLLMADDRIDGDALPLTQEFLAMMIGVRRAGVTVAIQELQLGGLIAAKRGMITILDRRALQECSNGTYAPPNDE